MDCYPGADMKEEPDGSDFSWISARREVYRKAGRRWPFEVYLLLEGIIVAAALTLMITLAFDSGSVWAVLTLLFATWLHHIRQLWRNPIKVIIFTAVGIVTNVLALLFGAEQPLLWALLIACVFRLIEGELMVLEEAKAQGAA